jgi:hypothetical protein
LARTDKQECTLLALLNSSGAFAEDGTLGLELVGWMMTMSQLAAAGDEPPRGP